MVFFYIDQKSHKLNFFIYAWYRLIKKKKVVHVIYIFSITQNKFWIDGGSWIFKSLVWRFHQIMYRALISLEINKSIHSFRVWVQAWPCWKLQCRGLPKEHSTLSLFCNTLKKTIADGGLIGCTFKDGEDAKWSLGCVIPMNDIDGGVDGVIALGSCGMWYPNPFPKSQAFFASVACFAAIRYFEPCHLRRSVRLTKEAASSVFLTFAK